MESDWQDIRDQTTWSPDAFAPRVYEQYVSRKPRMSGTRAGRWPSVWWVMASWCWMFQPSWLVGCGSTRSRYGRQTDADNAVSIGLAALNSTGVAVVHRRAPRQHAGGHARGHRRVRRPRLGRRPDHRHRNPRREQPAQPRRPRRGRTHQLTLHRRAQPPDLLLRAGAQPRRPQPGQGWRSHPTGTALTPARTTTQSRNGTAHTQHLKERCRSRAASAA